MLGSIAGNSRPGLARVMSAGRKLRRHTFPSRSAARFRVTRCSMTLAGIGVVPRRRRAAGDVLRAERQVAQAAFDAPHERRRPRQQREISRTDVAQSGILEQPPRLARPQQHRIAVELATHDGQPRQRIERVVLDDANQAARPHHPSDLTQEAKPSVRRDVMQHANRHREIERSVAIGQDIAVISLVFDVGMTAPRLGDAGRGNIGAAQAAEHARAQRTDETYRRRSRHRGRSACVRCRSGRHEVAESCPAAAMKRSCDRPDKSSDDCTTAS